jgi:hypothetical protein
MYFHINKSLLKYITAFALLIAIHRVIQTRTCLIVTSIPICARSLFRTFFFVTSWFLSHHLKKNRKYKLRKKNAKGLPQFVLFQSLDKSHRHVLFLHVRSKSSRQLSGLSHLSLKCFLTVQFKALSS